MHVSVSASLSLCQSVSVCISVFLYFLQSTFLFVCDSFHVCLFMAAFVYA